MQPPVGYLTDHFYLLFLIGERSFNYFVYYQRQMVPDDTKRQDGLNIMAVLF